MESVPRLWLKNLRDIIILPVSVSCVIPLLIYDPGESFIPSHVLLKGIAVLLIVSGLILFLYTVYLFNIIGQGTLAPWSQKVTLVIHGPYRYCRNPMISGVGLILCGEALFFHSTSILLWTLIFVIINTVYFMLIEEPALSKKFGDDYRQYRDHVPRWIPRMTPYEIDASQPPKPEH